MSVRDCRLAELWEQGQLCDIEVVAGGETFKAHRIVLAACSEFMQSLLTGGWRDSTGPLTLPDVDPSAFSTVLTWMYRGYVSVDRAALPAIFHAATLLQIATLQAAAEENVIALLRRGQMDPIEWWHTADALHLRPRAEQWRPTAPSADCVLRISSFSDLWRRPRQQPSGVPAFADPQACGF